MQRPILVTGMHRSGTTWVGEMINLSDQVVQRKEPFAPNGNNLHALGTRIVSGWLQYFTDQELAAYDPLLRHAFGLQFSLADLARHLRAARSFREQLGWLNQWRLYHQRSMQQKRVVVKDPNLLYNADRLASRFDLDLVVLKRHPAAFTSSLLRVDWPINPADYFLQYPDLVEHPAIRGFEDRLNTLASASLTQEEAIAHYWVMAHRFIKHLEATKPDQTVVRHEDLSHDAPRAFEEVYDQVGLAFSKTIEEKVSRYTGSDNPAEADENRVHQLQRDSRSNIYNWKNRLSKQQISTIYDIAGPHCQEDYPDTEW